MAHWPVITRIFRTEITLGFKLEAISSEEAARQALVQQSPRSISRAQTTVPHPHVLDLISLLLYCTTISNTDIIRRFPAICCE